MNETPIQRLQREHRELFGLFRQEREVSHKCVMAIDGLVELDDAQDERLDALEAMADVLGNRIEALRVLVSALTTPPADVAQAMLRSVDDADV